MSGSRKRSGKARVRRVRPVLEGLENRLTPSTFQVNTFLDTVAVNLKTGQDASGHVSLRSAIMAADANPASNTIVLPAGTFTLTIPRASGDGAANGDLNIAANVTIQGSKTAQTVIDGNSLDRVFDISSGRVAISNLVIEHGRAVGVGGGLLNSGGTVTLSSVQLFDNVAVGINGAAGSNGASEPILGLPAATVPRGPAARAARSSTRPGRSRWPTASSRPTRRSAGAAATAATVGSAGTSSPWEFWASAVPVAMAAPGPSARAVASSTRPAQA
jgi:hypothetical protein